MTWVAHCMGRMRPGRRTVWVARDQGGALHGAHATSVTRYLGHARPGFLCCSRFFSLCFWFFFFFFFSGLFSNMFWVLLYIYKDYKSSLRDSISMWSPRGKICHIGPHQTMEIVSQRLVLWAKIESLRLKMLVNNIVWENYG